MSFPLKRWIDDHHGVPHDLSRSGMPVGIPSVRRALRRPMEPDPEALRTSLAKIHHVPTGTLFLTHGATEATTLVLFYLARALGGGPPPLRCAVPTPEYPPVAGTARLAGFRIVGVSSEADVAAVSEPNNPTGQLRGAVGLRAIAEGRRAILIDETFREFTSAPTQAGGIGGRAWVVGSFTKLYGGDHLRVGFAIAPRSHAARFETFHGLLLDEIPPHSVSGARAVVRDRGTILPQVRATVRRNRAHLLEALPGLGDDPTPVAFDRPGLRSTDAFGRTLLRAGILVAPGRFFGDPTGVRIGLTRPTFADDLAAYLRVRARSTRHRTSK